MRNRARAAASRSRQYLIFMALLGVTVMALVASFTLRFEFSVPPTEVANLRWGLAGILLLKLPILYLTRLHRGWSQFSGLHDLKRIIWSNTAGSLLFAAGIYIVVGAEFPRSIYILDCVLTLAGICTLRVLVRSVRESKRGGDESKSFKRILIYGAGTAGTTVAREISANPRLGLRVAGFIDDAPQLANEVVLGLPVLGSGSKVAEVVRKLSRRGTPVEEILIAMPSASREVMSDILKACRESGLPCKTLPGLSDLLKNRHLSLQVRDINLEDLLSRETVILEEDNIRAAIAGKCVLITGAAGSIGSELATCVASFGPARLVLFDMAESPLHRIDLTLREAQYPCTIQSVIGDIRDYKQVETVLRECGVQTVFHAAAYKHVPMMEEHAVQAAANNILGTYNLAEAASRCGVSSFTLISSDKAVNPTNIMGATKRAAELIVLSYQSPATKFNAVRFGNVLGSNGSVVPIFQAQIARGGPVTVTHPDVTRFFMTVREAVQLVLQCSTMSKGSDVFVLDMGKPVRIVDLAQNVIRLAGLEPGVDIEIKYVGLRPGEKLYEEVIAEGESIAPTYHEKIKIFNGPLCEHVRIEPWIAELRDVIQAGDEAGVVRLLLDLIPEYQASLRWTQALSMPPLRAVSGFRTKAAGGKN